MYVSITPGLRSVQVRKKNGKPDLVLLDHGLYRQITDDFRLQYAGGCSLSAYQSLWCSSSQYCRPLAMHAIGGESEVLCAGLWRALVFGDAESIKQHAAAMNAADSYAFFASMLTMRPWEEITK